MRAKPPALETYPWTTVHDLRYVDADMNGHINNGLFGSLMETNRSLMFLEMRKAQTAEDNARMLTVIARFEIDYLKELNFPGPAVTAASGVEKIGGASFVLRQSLFSDGVCVALARSTIVMMGAESRRATPMTDALRAELGRWKVRDA
jgi:acyl-CoA thioester hydrolase